MIHALAPLIVALVAPALILLTSRFRRLHHMVRASILDPLPEKNARHIQAMERDLNIHGEGEGWRLRCPECDQMVLPTRDDICPYCGAGSLSLRGDDMPSRHRQAARLREDFGFNVNGGALKEEHDRLVDPGWRRMHHDEMPQLLEMIARGEYQHNITPDLVQLSEWQMKSGHPLVIWLNETEKRILALPNDREPPPAPKGLEYSQFIEWH